MVCLEAAIGSWVNPCRQKKSDTVAGLITLASLAQGVQAQGLDARGECTTRTRPSAPEGSDLKTHPLILLVACKPMKLPASNTLSTSNKKFTRQKTAIGSVSGQLFCWLPNEGKTK
jgi:uncharacterized lipoprotein YbaY